MRTIFVFGSNLSGYHGKGAALEAREKHGAKPGVASGPCGNSYAIPTKDANLKSLSLEEIQESVKAFLEYARTRSDLEFFVTPIGCGYAGYKKEQIAPMFKNAPNNCLLPAGWRDE
jgi:hypothetical protein